MQEFIYRSVSKTRADRVIWRLDRKRLRILCYHGICEDRLAAASWVPSCFVTSSRFEAQLRYLREHTTVLPLHDAVRRLSGGDLPPRCVAITFDDGYANNIEMAVPLLRKYSMPATIFLSTSYMESGDLYPFLKLKLLRLAKGLTGNERFPDFKSTPIDHVMEFVAPRFGHVEITADQRRTLRPMSAGEVTAAAACGLIEFGAHTHTHCILSNESSERRRQEIRTSIRLVANWTGKPARLFAYPNGQQGDFGDVDKKALRDEGIEAAVTGVAGANADSMELLDLRRYPVGLYHNAVNFGAEVTGFRSAVKSIGRTFGLYEH